MEKKENDTEGLNQNVDTVSKTEQTVTTDSKEVKANNKADKDKSPKSPKVADSLESVGKKLLHSYPDKDKIYMASDGQGFFNESDALNHANSLTNKRVTLVKK